MDRHTPFSTPPKFYNTLDRPPQKRMQRINLDSRKKLTKGIRVSSVYRHNTVIEDSISDRTLRSSFLIITIFFISSFAFSFFITPSENIIKSHAIDWVNDFIQMTVQNDIMYKAFNSTIISLFAYGFYSIATIFFYTPNVGVITTLTIFLDRSFVSMLYGSFGFSLTLFLVISTVLFSLKLQKSEILSLPWIVSAFLSILTASFATIMKYELCFMFLVPLILVLGCFTSPKKAPSWPVGILIFFLLLIISILTLFKIDSSYHIMRSSFDIPSSKDCIISIINADSNGLMILYVISCIPVLAFERKVLSVTNILIALFSIINSILTSICSFVSDIPDLALRGISCRLIFIAIISSLIASNSKIGLVCSSLCFIVALIDNFVPLPHRMLLNFYK
ncbi:hypothetical protein TVAG_275700 [Trichomonas vaginalis G3]|uniref:Transmembrane protein n=1 Tax=Trichomonas vaginalis (strain ATCC PRA-98 / G3) TaxID=412133 RepID=A2EYE3_TRIV3|nr:hypothetical protein TVAGG3_0863980 [Trichomonas vaginalis G3]EAY02296.1 hypothetical protein TVAG_275700 [Trichomonas vaginalis G3]KAI5500879.1 hypothetical protein TVAGG3_0863980 [Trichomonas vaginalis G3]|eukprot:XP_001314611.1 hypothetical protein [Trichomonas vaginalis G3]